VSAFYKKYAVYLELDPEEIVAAYRKQLRLPQNGEREIDFSTVVTLKSRGKNLIGILLHRQFMPGVIILSGLLFYRPYKNYLTVFRPSGLF
jgi:cytoskeletal protein RodZ